MDINKEANNLEEPTNMEVDDNSTSVSLMPESELLKEIKKEPADKDEIMQPEVREKLKEQDVDMQPESEKSKQEREMQSIVRKEPEEQNDDMQLKIKTEPQDIDMQPEVRENLKEQDENIQSKETKEPEQQDVDMQLESEKSKEQDREIQSRVRKEPEKQDVNMQRKIKKEPEDQDVDMQPEVRENLKEQDENIQSKESKEPEQQDVDMQLENEKSKEQEKEMQSRVREEPEKQDVNVQRKIKKEPEDQDVDMHPEVRKELGQDKDILSKVRNEPVEQDVDMQPEVEKEVEEQVETMQSNVRKEPEEQDDKEQTNVGKEPEEQDKNVPPDVRKESKEKEENIQFKIKKEPEDENVHYKISEELTEKSKNIHHEINQELREQEENKQSKESEEQDQEMQIEKRSEPEKQDENMQLEVSKEPKEQDENMQSQTPGRLDEKMLPEARKESEDPDKNDKPKVHILEDDHSEKKNEGSSKSSRNTEPDLKEIIRLSAGACIKDDNEEVIHLTAEEVKQYLLKKIGEYMNSSVNPLFTLRAKAKEIEEKGKAQVEEYCKLYRGLQLLQRKHENFLRNVDILPKVTMCHVNVSADLPMEPVPNPEALLKKELSITKVDNPTNKSTPVPPTQSKIPTTSASKSANIECIDLTDESEPAPTTPIKSTNYPVSMLKHPAPLPPRPFTTNVKRVPPRPRLKISAEDRGIVLQWDMPPNPKNNPVYDPIATFEIFGYQEQKNSVINTSLWKKIGSVKSMSLPMACTLTQFVDGNKYHFAIRAVDINGLCGNYSEAISIIYKQSHQK